MRQRLLDDRGGIDFVKIFMFAGVVAAFYFAWIYIPPYLDYMSIKKAVRTGCNAAYADRRIETVNNVILNGFRETAIVDEVIGVDGAVMRRPMPYDESLFSVRLLDTPPSVSVDLTYEQKIVWPLLKKPKTIRFNIRHTEDLSEIKY